MKSRKNRLHIAVGLVAIALALVAFTFAPTAPSVGAQQSPNIYAAAELVPEGYPDAAPPAGPYGVATFALLNDGTTRVNVGMTGLQANGRYSGHIHDGSCAGVVIFPLQGLEADTHGEANADTVFPGLAKVGRWYVDMHARDVSPGQGVLCGRVGAAVVEVPPAGQGFPGMPRTGEPFSLPLLAVLAALLAIVAGRCLSRARSRRPVRRAGEREYAD